MCGGGGRPITAFEISGGRGCGDPEPAFCGVLSSTYLSTRVWRGSGTMTLLPCL